MCLQLLIKTLLNFVLGLQLECTESDLGTYTNHFVVDRRNRRHLVGKSYPQKDGSVLLSLYFQGEDLLALIVQSSTDQQETIRYLLLTFGVLHSLPTKTHDTVTWFLTQLEGCIKNLIATSVKEKVEVEKKKTAEAEEARVEAEKARVEAEKAMVEAEKARVEAEKARVEAEKKAGLRLRRMRQQPVRLNAMSDSSRA